ncbi:RidA family protein [Bordetella sp. LUAb4]|uniref:RidA family protein n=1 Tax=Bordetella sp. LUAb4 TaxID=2843195 RepID=UPI001E32A5F4|nr:RidA family protein [Bordetella sp. LUAb4]
MSSIKRVNVAKRLSDMAVYNGVAYLAGQVPDDATLDITGQTAQVLATVDKLLAEAGTDKSRILMAQIFITNMKEFDGMNKAWDAWVADGNAPPRATVESRLANPDYKVEIVVTAAVG